MILDFKLREINLIMEDMTLSKENTFEPIIFAFNNPINWFLIGPTLIGILHIGQELMPWTMTLVKMHDSQKTC